MLDFSTLLWNNDKPCNGTDKVDFTNPPLCLFLQVVLFLFYFLFMLWFQFTWHFLLQLAVCAAFSLLRAVYLVVVWSNLFFLPQTHWKEISQSYAHTNLTVAHGGHCSHYHMNTYQQNAQNHVFKYWGHFFSPHFFPHVSTFVTYFNKHLI